MNLRKMKWNMALSNIYNLMNNYWVKIGILFVLFPVTNIFAQKKAWTLKECIDTGIQRNIGVKQGEVSNSINEINLKQAKENLYPSLNITDAPGYNFGKTQLATGAFVPLNTSSNAFALTGNFTLYSGMQLQNNIRENNFTYQAGIQNVETIKNNLSLNILTAYMQVLTDYEGVEIAQAQLKSDSTQVEQTKIYVMAGKYPELNLLQIESQLANDKLTKVNALNILTLAKVNLMQQMNLPVDYSFDVVCPAAIDSLLMVTAAASGAIFNTAEGFLPQIKNAELTTKATMAGMEVEKALYYPKLSLSGSIRSSATSIEYTENYIPSTVGYVDGLPAYPVEGYLAEEGYTNSTSNLWNQFNDNFNQFIGLNITIPIFNNFIARNSVNIARLNVQNAQLNEEQVKITLRQTIEQAYTNLLAAAEQYAASSEALRTEKETFFNMEKKYQVGLETATDYLVEESNYTKAQQNVAQAKYNYLFQVKLVDFYLDKPITF